MPNDAEDRKAAKSLELAESIKEQERVREMRKFQEEWGKRVEIARDGRQAYETSDPVTAIKNYKKILSLTARRYEVPIEKLSPKLFDKNTRVSESLLISAICFDLAKITERIESKSAEQEVRMYLRLFVLFSKGMPFEVVATGTLRKYVFYSRGLKYEKHFKETYKAMRKGHCFVATAVFEDPNHPVVVELRNFRDSTLRRNLFGRLFIGVYAITGPLAATVVELFPGLKKPTKFVIRKIIQKIRLVDPSEDSTRAE